MLRRRRSACIGVVVATLALFSFLLLNSPRTAGQQQNFPQPNRKPACTCFCGDGTFKSFNLFSREDAVAGKCYGGPLPADACGRLGGDMPAEQRRAICQGLNAGRSSSCPAVKAFCDEQGDAPKQDCQKPAPWFDQPSDCKDVQAPVIAINNRAVTISICGLPVYRGAPTPPVNDLALTAYKDVISAHVQRTVGSKVCCDRVHESARTGTPCFPGVDIDCDGVPNSEDTYRSNSVSYPDINLFTKSGNASVDEFPPGLNPDDANFLPGSTARDSKGVGDCPCKWELTSGKLACSSDGQKDHVYTATWKCPANGKEVFTTKYAKASAPCKEYQRTAGANFFFEYSNAGPSQFLRLQPAALRSPRCGE